MLLFSSVFVRDHAAPKAFCPPNAGAQTFQLHDLAVIDEQVHVDAMIFDVPFEHIGIGGFKHEFFHADFVYEFSGDVGAPWIDILCNAFALDHDAVSTGL